MSRRPVRDTARNRDNVVLTLLLVALSASFYYGWFVDNSHPLGGMGWADQTSYVHAAIRLAHWHLPTKVQMHYPATYPLMGALGSLVSRDDPFWIVSYGLLMGSAVFAFRAARTILNTTFTALFIVLLFAWDGHARMLSYTSEVFTIPWNNQVLFFVFAFFFWLCTVRASTPLDTRIVVVIGVVVGLTAMTREESVLFCVPLAAFYLWWCSASLRSWVVCAIATVLAALPGLIIKALVLGSIFSTGRDGTYGNQQYFSLARPWQNLLGTIVNSDLAPKDYNRISLFEAQPWLWLAPIGLVILFVSKRYSLLTKFWVFMSLVLIAFYLSGPNVTAARLRYHCLRYMSPAYIALNFAAVMVGYQLWVLVRGRDRRAEPPGRQGRDPEPGAPPTRAESRAVLS
jgi:hypothetical protein